MSSLSQLLSRTGFLGAASTSLAVSLPLLLISCGTEDRELAPPRAAPELSSPPATQFQVYRTSAAHVPNRGGRATACSITPALPEGLALSVDTNVVLPNSCLIHGIPVNALDKTTYMVTASNGLGSSASSVDLTVIYPAPLFDDKANQAFEVGQPVTLDFLNKGGRIIEASQCTISPALPDGLALGLSATGGCEITGMPRVASNEAVYNLVATTAGGRGQSNVAIETYMPAVPATDTLVWSDEFDGTALDAADWDVQTGTGTEYGLPAGWGNNELQNYRNDPANIRFADGILSLTANRESGGGYTSARIRTFGKQSFKYLPGGTLRIEARIRMPEGLGTWPAFWMLSENDTYGTWPLSGEIDIVEAANLGVARTGVQIECANRDTAGQETTGTTHYGMFAPQNQFSGSYTENPFSVTDNFNIYAIEWEAGEIRWYVNSEHRYTQTSEQWFTLSERTKDKSEGGDGILRVLDDGSPFDQPFHLILNLAIGGNGTGNMAPDASTSFPQSLDVDYVRVTQCGSDRAASSCYKSIGGAPAPDAPSYFTNCAAEPAASNHTAEVRKAYLFGQEFGSVSTTTEETEGDVTTSTTRVAVFEHSVSASGAAAEIVDGVNGGQAIQMTYSGAGGLVQIDQKVNGAESFMVINGNSDKAPDSMGRPIAAQLVFDLTVKQLPTGNAGLELRVAGEGGVYLSQAIDNARLAAVMAAPNNTQRLGFALTDMDVMGGAFDASRIVSLFWLGSTGVVDADNQIVVEIDNAEVQSACLIPEVAASPPCGVAVGAAPGGPAPIPLVSVDPTDDISGDYPNTQMIYTDGPIAGTNLSVLHNYTEMGTTTVTNEAVTGRGMVLQCSTDAPRVVCGLGRVANGATGDWTAFKVIEFDIRVVTLPTAADANTELLFKFETAPSNFEAEVSLGPISNFTDGWHRIRVDISNDATWRNGNGVYDRTMVSSALFFPTWENATGGVWQVDNILLRGAASQ